MDKVEEQEPGCGGAGPWAWGGKGIALRSLPQIGEEGGQEELKSGAISGS